MAFNTDLVTAPEQPIEGSRAMKSKEGHKEQGKCETTLTERFEYAACSCNTYEGNLGPCKGFEAGSDPKRCVYCDHTIACHQAL